MRTAFQRVIVNIVIVALALLTVAYAHAQTWKPTRNVELVAPSSAGGGSDNIARLVQKILQEQKLVDAPVSVINKAASGGVVAWNGLNQNPIDGHQIGRAHG